MLTWLQQPTFLQVECSSSFYCYDAENSPSNGNASCRKMKLTFENNWKTSLRYLTVHQIMCKRHRILPLFELLAEPNATRYVYVYDDGTTRKEQLLNYDPLQITVHAWLLRHSVLARSTGRLEPEMLLTLRWLMSYIYGAPILDVSRSHTTTQHSR